MKLEPELIIFDCDGVLVDSEPIATRVLVGVLAELGLPMSEAAADEQFLGRSRSAAIELIEHALGHPVPDGFAARWQALTLEAFGRELRLVPGIEAALERLTAPVCVASSSDPARIRLSLELAGLLPRFEGRIFSATQVALGKPAPDLFLFAAQSMGTAPARCVVVEDSLLGVRAAVAAGMPVFGYAPRGSAVALALTEAGATVFSDMQQLPDLL